MNGDLIYIISLNWSSPLLKKFIVELIAALLIDRNYKWSDIDFISFYHLENRVFHLVGQKGLVTWLSFQKRTIRFYARLFRFLFVLKSNPSFVGFGSFCKLKMEQIKDWVVVPFDNKVYWAAVMLAQHVRWAS